MSLERAMGWVLFFAWAGAWALSGCGSNHENDTTTTASNGPTDAGADDDATGADTGGGQQPTTSCGFGKKECDGACVAIDDPAYGCTETSCSPCELLNAAATCFSGQCIPDSCVAPFADCDGNSNNGCETNTQSDAHHCGACNNPCPSNEFCLDGECSDGCGDKTNCQNSCVDIETDVQHCGGCFVACKPPAHGQATCVHGQCAFTCTPGYSKCDSLCVDLNHDPDNCGACGHSCLGGACSDGQCQPVVLRSLSDSPMGIAVANGKVYWSQRNTGTIWSMSTSGAGAKQILTTDKTPREIVVSGDSIYWTSDDTGKVYKAPKQGCSSGGSSCVQTVYDPGQDANWRPIDFVIGGSNIYLFEQNSKKIMRIPLAGGATTVLSTEQGQWVTLAIIGGDLFWADYENQVIKKTALPGQTVSTFTNTTMRPWALHASGSDLYFIDYGHDDNSDHDQIMVIHTPNTSPQLVQQSPPMSGYIDSDGQALYWTTVKSEKLSNSDNRIMKSAL